MAYAKIAEQSEQSKKITRILIAVLVAIILAIACLALAPTVLAMTVCEYRVISGVSEPVQTAVKTGVLRLSGDTWSGSAKYLAEYRIKGLVIGAEHYSSNSLYDRVSPLDISLAWGEAAAHNNLIRWQRGNRQMEARVSKMAEWMIGEQASEIFTQYSNNHIIVDDDMLRSKLMNVSVGDYIELSGYLVDVTIHDRDDQSAYYELKSSLRRDDSGDNSCEVLYVTRMEQLD